MPRRFHVRTFGCQMNEHDSERLAGMLAAEGMEETEEIESADVIVLNTCCIRQNADNRLYGHLGHLASLKARRPGTRIVVGGCLAQKDGGLVQERAPHVDVVLGTHNVGRLVALLGRAEREGPVTEIVEDDAGEATSGLPVRRAGGHAAWVTIQTGCDNSCSFCIVPSVRGREASRPFGAVVAEVAQAARDGVSEVTLLGQNVNSYGRDITLGLRSGRHAPGEVARLAGPGWAGSSRRKVEPLFADLLRAVADVGGVRRVRFTSPHPKDLRPETIAAMAETPEVCEHLHLPLQSGSDKVLASMRRGYTAQRYLSRLEAARREIEDLAVTTDVIVGFPGETEDDFAQTLEVVAEAGYDSAYTFVFSPRPGTRAAQMREDFVPPAVVAERFDRLKVVLERSALARAAARIGRVEEVVVEGPSRKDPSVLSARTRQNKLVHFPTPGGGTPPRPGSYIEVEVTAAAPHHLSGIATSAASHAAG